MLSSRFTVAGKYQTFYSGGSIVQFGDKIACVNQANVSVCDLSLSTFTEVDTFEDSLADPDDVVTALAHLTAEGDGFLMIAYRSCQIRILDLSTMKTVQKWKGHEAPVLCCSVKRIGVHIILATGSADSSVKCWDLSRTCAADASVPLNSQSFTHHFKAHRGLVTALAFGFDWTLTSGDEYGNVRYWDLQAAVNEAPRHTRGQSSYLKASFDCAHASLVRCIGWNGKLMITGGRDKVVCIYELVGDNLKLINTVPLFECVEACGYISAEYFYTAGDSGCIKLWSLVDNRVVASYNGGGEMSQALFNGTSFIVASTNQKLAKVLFTADGFQVQKYWVGSWDEVSDLKFVAFNKSQYMLVASGSTQDLRLLKVNPLISGSPCKSMGDVICLSGHSKAILCIDSDMLPDGRYLAVSGSKDNIARIWLLTETERVITYSCIGECAGHAGDITSVSLSKFASRQELNQRYLLTTSEDRTVKRWDLGQCQVGECVKLKSTYTVQCHDKDVNCVAICPSYGKNMFATSSQDKTIKLWNAETGQLLQTLKGHRRGVWNVAFSTSPQTAVGLPILVSCSSDKTIKVWSMLDYQCLNSFEGHTNSVLKVSFIPGDNQVLSTGSDGLCKVWNVKGGECVVTLDEHDDKIWANSVTISNEKTLMASGGSDASIVLYLDSTAEHLEEEHKKAEELLLHEQTLDNHFRSKNWLDALKMSLRLNKSVKCAQLIRHIIEEDSQHQLLPLFEDLNEAELVKILNFIKDWNTQSKFAIVAQTSLYILFANRPPQTFIKLPGIKNIIDAMLPHTERHFGRLQFLEQQSFAVDFVLQ